MKNRAAVFLTLILILGFTACHQKALADTPQSRENSGKGTLAAIDLYNEFKQDVNGVSQKYNGKNVEVSGIVVRTGPDIHGTPSIELSNTPGGKAYVLFVVNAFSQLNEVSIGDTVTMSGNFHIFGSDDWVVLKQGEILNASKNTSAGGNSAKTLIVYFSATGNTEAIAEIIHRNVESDIFRITTVNSYPTSYSELTVRAEQERRDNIHPALAEKIGNMDDYGTIFLGYPIWYGMFPQAVAAFLNEYDLSGKTIIPFCTCGGSGLGETVPRIRQLAPDSVMREGLAVLASNVRNAQNDVQKWIGALGMK